jgi:hypothetical protein
MASRLLRCSITYTYIIYAGLERGDKNFYSAPLALLIDKSLKPLKLVLAKEGYAYKEVDALKSKSRN